MLENIATSPMDQQDNHYISEPLRINLFLFTGIAESVTTQLPGTSAFLFGHADLPLKRGLVARRKAVHWFDGCHGSSYDGIAADVGAPPASRYGLTGNVELNEEYQLIFRLLFNCKLHEILTPDIVSKFSGTNMLTPNLVALILHFNS